MSEEQLPSLCALQERGICSFPQDGKCWSWESLWLSGWAPRPMPSRYRPCPILLQVLMLWGGQRVCRARKYKGRGKLFLCLVVKDLSLVMGSGDGVALIIWCWDQYVF